MGNNIEPKVYELVGREVPQKIVTMKWLIFSTVQRYILNATNPSSSLQIALEGPRFVAVQVKESKAIGCTW